MSAAEGFRQLADMFEVGTVPAHDHADVPLDVVLIAKSEFDLYEFATREGLPVSVTKADNGTIHSSAELTLDGSVTLRCVHISHS